MARQRRSDPYQYVATWEPARAGIGSDLGEALLTGILVGAMIVTGDYVAFGAWCDWGSIAWVLTTCVTLAWLRLRLRVRAAPTADSVVDGDVQQPRDRVILVNSRGSGYDAGAELPYSDFERFVRLCAQTTARRDHEAAGLTRETFAAFRDSLIDSGWAQWKNDDDHKSGWRLTAEPEEILRALG